MKVFFACVPLLAIVCAAGLPAVARSEEAPTVAVVDFVSTNGPVDGVMLGAADLLEVELGRYDVRVISRRELNLLRGERGLARSGTVRIEDFQGGALPWADFLLRGEYQYTPGESGVRFRLVDAKTGTERGSWQLLVERPADLVKNLDPILPKIAAAVCGGTVAPRPRNQPGFTTIPEVASTFYHGLDHMVSGRPEYAAEYFRIAAASDTGFSLAVLAQAKAYEQLGFPRVADAVRATIPAGQMPQAQAVVTSAVLTVRFVDRSDAFTSGQMQRIRDALQETHGFALFEPDWIPALTRETDLKLSEDFPLVHGLDHRLWLRADHFIVFSAEKQGLRASVIDLVRGELLGTVSGGSTNLDGLCAEAVAVIRQPVAEPLAPLSRVVTTNGPAVHLTGTFSVDEIAFALRRLSDHPKDMACWSHLMVLIQCQPGYKTAFRAFVPYFEAAIPRDVPDTPVWLAAAGWMRYLHDAELANVPLPMEGYFTELLNRYPDHLQSLLVRYNSALVPGYRGDLERSLPVVVEVEAKVAAQVAAIDDFIPIHGCHIDAIAQMNYENFPVTLPPHGPRMTMLARGIYSAAAYMYRETGKPAQAEPYIEKQRQLQGRLFWGSGMRLHMAGPMTIHPTFLGLWQTGHIGYEWQPADPEDNGRVLVGWTFMPFTLPGWQTVQAEFEKRQGETQKVAPTGPPPDTRSPREIWAQWLNTCTNSALYEREAAFYSGLSSFTYACTKERRERGAAAAAVFAGEALAEFRGAGQDLAKTFGEIRSGKLALQFYRLAAQLCLEAGDSSKAWTHTQQALAWRGRDNSKYSLRYQSAMAAWTADHADTAALILRTVAEDSWAKDLPLTLPYATAQLRSVYLESVDLLEKVRAGPATNSRPADIDLTPVRPYYLVGNHRPGTKEQERPKRSMRDPTKDEEWARIMELWYESQCRAGAGAVMADEDVMPESYEAWPEPEDVPDWVRVPSPPRFGEHYVYEIDDEVSMEFVWIEPMRMWVAKYELTEIEWYHVTTTTRTSGRLPMLLTCFSDSQPFFNELNRRAQKGLPEGYCYRSPTVREWEQLARCGSDRVYPWGNSMPPRFGNYRDQSYAKAARARGENAADAIDGYDDGHEQVAPVEDSGANAWGLYGMGGNLWDWTIKQDGRGIGKGGTWQSSGDELQVDAGYWVDDWGDGGTLRVVLAPELKPVTPAR